MPSKRVAVLNCSNLPVRAASRVLLIRALVSAGVRGLKVFAASKAWSRRSMLSQPLITTLVDATGLLIYLTIAKLILDQI